MIPATIETAVTLQIPHGEGRHPERRVTHLCAACDAEYLRRVLAETDYASRPVSVEGSFGKCWGYGGRHE